MRRIVLVVGLVIFAGVALIGFWLFYALNGVASLQPGMIELHLPSGATAYLRRQAYFNKPADVYVSASDDFCKPFDRWHDYKMSTNSWSTRLPTAHLILRRYYCGACAEAA